MSLDCMWCVSYLWIIPSKRFILLENVVLDFPANLYWGPLFCINMTRRHWGGVSRLSFRAFLGRNAWLKVRKSFCCAAKANSKVILGVTESRFVLGAVKHNSAFSTVTRANISMGVEIPRLKRILRFFYQIILLLRILRVNMQTDFKSNDDLKKVVFKKLFHLFSS